MGDSRRFDLFGEVCAKNLRPDMRIADIAGGKGYLQANLRKRGFSDVISWDRRPRMAKGRKTYRFGYFDYRTAPVDYDAVVALHPDAATDHAIMYAGARRVPAIICPCCAIPSAVAYWGSRGGYDEWVRHLIRLATRNRLDVTHTALRMTGRNQVLILRPLRGES